MGLKLLLAESLSCFSCAPVFGYTFVHEPVVQMRGKFKVACICTWVYFTVSAVTSQVVEVVFKQLEGKKGGETGEGKGVRGGGGLTIILAQT